MSGICSHCSGCTRYHGTINVVLGMTYACAEDCHWYQMERKARLDRIAERHAKAVELQQLRSSKRLSKVLQNAVEVTWAAKEFPRQYDAGWKLLSSGSWYIWRHESLEGVMSNHHIVSCPGFDG